MHNYPSPTIDSCARLPPLLTTKVAVEVGVEQLLQKHLRNPKLQSQPLLQTHTILMTLLLPTVMVAVAVAVATGRRILSWVSHPCHQRCLKVS